MSLFVHTQGIKTVHAGGRGVRKWPNYVHVVVECPLKGPGFAVDLKTKSLLVV